MTSVLAALPLFLLPAAADGPPTPSALDTWITRLSDPSFARRQEAVEKLYAAGPEVLEALSGLLTGPDAEAALRAQRLITRIRKLYLVGARVSLTIDRPRAAWDEPLALRVEIVNARDFPIHLPFLTGHRETLDSGPDAAQVGAALDVADFLEVIGPDGRRVDLVIDDYRGDPHIEQAVESRAYLEPASDLPAGQRFTLDVRAFNRGPARWRLLEAGTYRLRFVYVPEWEEPSMVANRIGLIASDELAVEISRAAPPIIDRGSRMIRSEVTLEDGDAVSTLQNVHDRPMTVNANIGGPGERLHAQVQWRVQRGAAEYVSEPVAAPQPISPERIVQLAPGERVTVHRTPVAPLLDRAGGAGPARVSARYTNLFDRTRDVPASDRAAACRARLGIPTFVGSIYSDPVTAE